MDIPSAVQQIIAQERDLLKRVPEKALLPARRLAVYAACGPTYFSSTYEERLALIMSGQARLTYADRVRARLALLTAEHVLPLWLPALEEARLLTQDQIDASVGYALSALISQHVAAHVQALLSLILEHTPIPYERLREQIDQLPPEALAEPQRSVLLEYLTLGRLMIDLPTSEALALPLDSRLAAARSIYEMPLAAFPYHVVQLARGVEEQHIRPDDALSQAGDIHAALGNMFEDDLPAQGYYITLAALEALYQAIGIGPFDRQEVTPTTTDELLQGEGAAAAPALKAASGVFEGVYATDAYDPVQRQIFWSWWIQEAIPQAWTMEATPVAPDAATMPFERTVRTTAYPTGIEFSFDIDRQDDLLV